MNEVTILMGMLIIILLVLLIISVIYNYKGEKIQKYWFTQANYYRHICKKNGAKSFKIRGWLEINEGSIKLVAVNDVPVEEKEGEK